jgi:hypothetical protein
MPNQGSSGWDSFQVAASIACGIQGNKAGLLDQLQCETTQNRHEAFCHMIFFVLFVFVVKVMDCKKMQPIVQ